MGVAIVANTLMFSLVLWFVLAIVAPRKWQPTYYDLDGTPIEVEFPKVP